MNQIVLPVFYIIYYVNRNMSDTDSGSSTDSDNNNVSPFFNHYLGNLEDYVLHVESAPDSSSDSDFNLDLNYLDSPSSDVSFQSSLIIYLILI